MLLDLAKPMCAPAAAATVAVLPVEEKEGRIRPHHVVATLPPLRLTWADGREKSAMPRSLQRGVPLPLSDEIPLLQLKLRAFHCDIPPGVRDSIAFHALLAKLDNFLHNREESWHAALRNAYILFGTPLFTDCSASFDKHTPTGDILLRVTQAQWVHKLSTAVAHVPPSPVQLATREFNLHVLLGAVHDHVFLPVRPMHMDDRLGPELLSAQYRRVIAFLVDHGRRSWSDVEPTDEAIVRELCRVEPSSLIWQLGPLIDFRYAVLALSLFLVHAPRALITRVLYPPRRRAQEAP